MDLFRKSKKPEKNDDQDGNPIWSQVRKFRENLKRKEKNEEAPSQDGKYPGQPRPSDPSGRPGPPPPSPSEDSEMSYEYQCTQCNLKFKDSWNRCPKCGGEVEPFGLDKSEDIKKLYPEPQAEGEKKPGTRKGVPRGAAGSSARSGKAVKIVRRARPSSSGKAAVGNQREKGRRTRPSRDRTSLPRDHTSPSRDRTSLSPSRDHTSLSAKGSHGALRDQKELDDLFSKDPLLDTNDIKIKEIEPVHRKSWKNVPPLVEPAPYAHTPPPEVRSMLKNLMTTEVDQAESAPKGTCPKCGFRNPPGNWDFCMKCGFHY